ncbi:MAG: OmpA family protein [Bacteroidetes bacterium]|nr:OmpA family protein [Bacteroidota bacterium]
MKTLKSLFIISLIVISSKVDSQNIQPTLKEALLNVVVMNPDGKTRKNETIIFEGVKSKKKYEGITNKDGKFSFLIPKGETYKIRYKVFTDAEDYSTMEIPETDDLLTTNLTIKIEMMQTYVLNNVLFDTGKSSLTKESYKGMDELVDLMKRKNTLVIEISGHTDNVGSKALNLKLSQDRANTVMNYLISKGIEQNRVSAKGYGDTQPVSPNESEYGRQKNRRTEVKIISE